MFDEYFDYLKKKYLFQPSCLWREYRKKSNSCSIYKSKLQIIRNFMIKILENTKKLFVFVQ